jgi:hypothetical protein
MTGNMRREKSVIISSSGSIVVAITTVKGKVVLLN